MNFKLPDIHGDRPEVALHLKKVGVVGLKMPVGFISFEGKPVMVVPTFDVYIDLPADQKGIHSSRNYEVTTEILSQYLGKMYRLEELCASVSRELFRKHEYITRSEVKAYGEAIFEKRTPITDVTTLESCDIMARAIGLKTTDGSINVKKFIGVGVIGTTACPCAIETIRESSRQRLVEDIGLSIEEAERVLNQVPIATHIQRSYGSIVMEIPEGFEVDAMSLVRIVEDSMSASTFELLKRPDEVEVVRKAVSNPMFVEDCVRSMAVNIVEGFPELPDDTSLVFMQRNEESIHKHDLVAERSTTMGEIREELKLRAGEP